MENPSNRYIDIIIHTLSLNLLGQDKNDSIASVKAVRTNIGLTMSPHEEKFSAQISLQELVYNSRDRAGAFQEKLSNVSRMFGDHSLMILQIVCDILKFLSRIMIRSMTASFYILYQVNTELCSLGHVISLGHVTIKLSI